jgi:protein ImuB
MQKRFLSIWFPYLTTDWLCLRQPELSKLPFVFAIPERGRKIITAMNALAQAEGITQGMPVADAKAIVPGLQVFDEKPGRDLKLLKALGEWCIRYSPVVGIDPPNGLLLDCSGCSHLWGGEASYREEMVTQLKSKGYNVRVGIADTIGTAWAIARFGKESYIIEKGKQADTLLSLPAAALRLENNVLQRLHKLGLHKINSFMSMPRSALRRRFGEGLLQRLSQALEQEEEYIQPIQVPDPYQERLSSMEPIRTATGIEIAIKRLLESLCERLQNEGKGLRIAILKCYRLDGRIEQVEIGTNKASNHVDHLFKLFALKISGIKPALGIELFTLDAAQLEDVTLAQEAIWTGSPGLENQDLVELLDRLAAKIGVDKIHRYLPDEHYWPERSVKSVSSLTEKATTPWRTDRPRPTLLLSKPALIDVTAPIPDYPPMSFRYQGKLHYIKKADGPERIEREWWIDAGEHRDYYQVEDEAGQRYWLFRSGHYGDTQEWFIHGFFA